MRDRQYFVSLAGFVGIAGLVFAGAATLLVWLGRAGSAGLMAIVAGILAWFYWGPRSDLKPRS
jgi:hypothetical protein